jgi:hypothetical protein
MTDDPRKADTMIDELSPADFDEDTNPGREPIPAFVPRPPVRIPEAPEWMNSALFEMSQRQHEFADYARVLLSHIDKRDARTQKMLRRAINQEAGNKQSIAALETRIDDLEIEILNIKKRIRNCK